MMRWTRAGLALALLSVLLVTACGKRGPPVPPGPHDKVTWPQVYPRQ